MLDFHSKNLQITSKLLTQGYTRRYHFEKHLESSLDYTPNFCRNFGDISFQEFVSRGISHPVFYGDLVYKLRRVKDASNFISSGSKIDKRLRPWQYVLLIMDRTIGLSRFISNSSHCSTSILSKHIRSALTAVKDHVIKYSETAFNNSNMNYFWSIKNSSEVIEKLRLRNFQGSQVSSFDFSTLYTSLPIDIIKAKVLSLVNLCFDRESKTYLCTSAKAGFFSKKKI